MKTKMLIVMFGLGLVLLPAGHIKAEEAHSHEHGMAEMHGSMEHGERGHMKGEGPEMEAGMEKEGAVYTCPMHPEVRETQPGKCPICGMFLERVESNDEGLESLEAEKIESGEDHSKEDGHEHQHG